MAPQLQAKSNSVAQIAAAKAAPVKVVVAPASGNLVGVDPLLVRDRATRTQRIAPRGGARANRQLRARARAHALALMPNCRRCRCAAPRRAARSCRADPRLARPWRTGCPQVAPKSVAHAPRWLQHVP